jgi:hypothetical protein
LFGGSDFGGALDLDGDRLVVGASGNGAGHGAAYVFERNAGGGNQWGQVAKLVFPGRFYGEDVAIDGDTILVSRPGNVVTAGSVDVYDRDSPTGEWLRTARLFHPESHIQDGYGRAVAVSGDLAVVGSGDNVEGGKAFVYGRHRGGQDHWGLLATLTSPSAAQDPWYGFSAAIMGNYVLVGSWGVESAGAVYVFAVPEPSPYTLVLCGLAAIASHQRCRLR